MDLLGACLLSACAPGTDEPPGTAQPPAAEGPIPVPALTIHSDELGEHPLGAIGQVLVHRSGALYVTQPRERTVLAYSPTGEFRFAFGRQGEAPGEFTQLSRVGWLGDTLWISDAFRRRVSLFDTAGGFLGSFGFSPEIEGAHGAHAVAMLADGSVLVSGGWSISALARSAADSVPLVRTSRDGSVRATLGHLAVRNRALSFTSGGGTIVGVQPLDDSPLVAAAADGSGFVVADPGVEAGRMTFRVTRIAADGETVFSRACEFEPRPITDPWLDTLVARLGPPLNQVPRDRLYRPSHVPPVSMVVAARDGTTWLRAAQPLSDSASVEWRVLAPDGSEADVVLLPASVRVHEADGRRFWATTSDADGVPQIDVYDLR